MRAHCLILTLLAAPTLGIAADLNAPVVSQPTIRTEIDRGYQRAVDCPLRLSPFDLSGCFARLESDDLAQQATPDAFRLGLRLGAWLAEDARVRTIEARHDRSSVTANELEAARVNAADHFGLAKQHMRALGLTDDEALTASGLNFRETQDRFAYWNERYNSALAKAAQ